MDENARFSNFALGLSFNESHCFVFSTLYKTGALVSYRLLDVNELPRLALKQSLHDEEHKALSELRRLGILVPSDLDELQLVEVIFEAQRYQHRSVLFLTIAPTLGCNLDCAYCYQGERVSSDWQKMDETVIRDIVDFVAHNIENRKKLWVTWYGGEPLLAFDEVKQLSERFMILCKKSGVDYCADMITNGTLVTPEVCKALVEFNVIQSQITVDGPQEVHDARRVGRNGEPTYERVLGGIALLLEHGIRVAIRINLDKDNRLCISDTLDLLKQRGLIQPNSRVHLGRVRKVPCPDYRYKEYLDSAPLGLDEFAEASAFLSGLLRSMSVPEAKLQEKLLSMYVCPALTVDAAVISPRGLLLNCWSELHNPPKDARLLGDRTLPISMNELAWLRLRPFDNEACRECRVLPLCLGGCPYYVKDGPPPSDRCSPIRYQLERMLKDDLAAKFGSNYKGKSNVLG